MSFNLFNRSIATETENVHFLDQANEIQERYKVFLRCIDTLLHFLKSLAVDVKELERTKTRSITDSLTGVYNRQAIDDILTELIDRSRVMTNTFRLLMLGMDNFKHINDTYGHLIGDRVLVAFCQKCRDNIRADDYIARSAVRSLSSSCQVSA